MSRLIETIAAPLQSLEEVAELVDSLTPEEVVSILYDWQMWQMEHQALPPGDWTIWVQMSGRGGGKTFGAASQMNEWANDKSLFGGGDVLLAGKTYDSVRETMIEGPSGLLNTAKPQDRPRWYSGKQLLIWPSGVRGVIATGDKPQSFREQNIAKAWLDELAHWQSPEECFKTFELSLRMGPLPQALVTTTPTSSLLMQRFEDEAKDPESGTVLTRADTMSNPHLHPKIVARLVKRYGGTRWGEQELKGAVLRDIPGALWKLANIDENRVKRPPAHIGRIVVAADPNGKDDSDKDEDDDARSECGIIVVGQGLPPLEDHFFVLEDCSVAGDSFAWGEALVDAYFRWEADCIVGEVNFGGEMVSAIVRAVCMRRRRKAKFTMVRASRGKRQRAEPVEALYQQKFGHHCGTFPKLEKQLTTWVPDKGLPSPDRLDALVWGVTELMLGDEEEVGDLSAYAS